MAERSTRPITEAEVLTALGAMWGAAQYLMSGYEVRVGLKGGVGLTLQERGALRGLRQMQRLVARCERSKVILAELTRLAESERRQAQEEAAEAEAKAVAEGAG